MSLHPRHIPDGEIKALLDIRHLVPMHMRTPYDAKVADRQNQLFCSHATMKDWANRWLLELDEYLRIRWEFDTSCYVIERVDTGLRAWIPLFFHRDEHDAAKMLNSGAIFEILGKLREGDMRRFASPDKYLEYKRNKSAQVRKSLENKHNDMVYGAVDSLSNRQVSDMIAAEKAIAVGEKVKPYGKDAEFLNKVWERQKSGFTADIPSSDSALNPGNKPGTRPSKYQRIQI